MTKSIDLEKMGLSTILEDDLQNIQGGEWPGWTKIGLAGAALWVMDNWSEIKKGASAGWNADNWK